MYPSEQAEAKRQRVRKARERRAVPGWTEIILVLPRERVAELDAVKSRHGLRNRSQVVEQLLLAGRETDQRGA